MRITFAVALAFCALQLEACAELAPRPGTTPAAHTSAPAACKGCPPSGFGDIDVRDANGVTRTYKTTVDIDNVQTSHVIVDDMPAVTVAASAAPASVTNTSFWTGITSASTQSSSALDTAGFEVACFEITELSTSTPVGTFSVTQSIDNSTYSSPIYLDANRVSGANFTGAGSWSGGTTIPVSSPGGTVSAFFCLAHPMRYLKLTWTRTSGGTTSAINAFTYLIAG